MPIVMCSTYSMHFGAAQVASNLTLIALTKFNASLYPNSYPNSNLIWFAYGFAHKQNASPKDSQSSFTQKICLDSKIFRTISSKLSQLRRKS